MKAQGDQPWVCIITQRSVLKVRNTSSMTFLFVTPIQGYIILYFVNPGLVTPGFHVTPPLGLACVAWI